MINFNKPMPELDLWEGVKLYITETDVYKWGFGISITILGFFSKISWNFLKGRNNKLDELNKRVTKIEKSLVVTRSGGKEMMVSECVIEIIHKLDNHDIGESGVLQLILDELKELKDEKKNK